MVSTYGILFMGTPHQGCGGVTLGLFLQNLISIFAYTNKKMLVHLEMYSEWLDSRQKLFLPISNNFDTIYFYETYATPLLTGGALLVCSSESSLPRLIFGYQLTVSFRLYRNTRPASQELWALPGLLSQVTTPIWSNSRARRTMVSKMSM